jgi:branched-chain amino acid transport system permease protein
MAILGGRGTVAGPVIGAIVLVAADELVVAKLGSTELNIAAKAPRCSSSCWRSPDGIVGTLKARRRLPRILDWG